MLSTIIIPPAIPVKKVPDYRMPEDTANLLGWDFVATQMTSSRYYWLTTVAADGHPHAVPVWGIWYNSKYQVDKGSPYWYVHPKKVLAWNGAGLLTMTRWLFAAQ